MTSNPYVLPAAVGASIAIILLIYWFGGKVAKKREDNQKGYRDESYACGEDFPPKDVKVNLEKFFIFAIYLLIFDVLVFMLGTSPPSVTAGPIVYLIIVMAATAMLIVYREAI